VVEFDFPIYENVSQSLRKMGFPKAVHVEVPLLIMLKIPRCSVAANSPQHAFSLTVLASGGPSPFGRKSHLLKFESGGDLDAIEPQLVKEIVIALVPEIIVKVPGILPRNRCYE